MLKTLFVNADKNKPQCSIYQTGIEYGQALANHSKLLDVEIVEISTEDDLPYYINSVDLIIFNYHSLPFRNIAHIIPTLTPKKLAIIIDMGKDSNLWKFQSSYPNNEVVFDWLGIPDPTLVNHEHESVVFLPRVIPRRFTSSKKINMENPVVSTFGLQSYDKPMHLIAEALAKEFDHSTLRINVPQSSHENNIGLYDDIIQWYKDECASVAGAEKVDVQITTEFMNTGRLLSWLSEGDAVAFFYGKHRDEMPENRNIPASIDLALATKLPLLISNSKCCDHLFMHILPYPMWSIKESMEKSIEPISKLYDDWSPQEFARTMDWFLEDKWS